MEISFEGQAVVVTGAGGGLGRTYALELARRGAGVVVNDLAGADEVVAEIEAAGGRAVAAPESVATPEGGQAIVDAAVDAFGTVDAVIHNAGAWRHVPYGQMTVDNLDPVLDVHLRGAFFVTRPAWTVMQEKGYGRLVLTSSSSGTFGRESGSNYAAAKAAMLGLGRALSLEGDARGIRTNCLLPIAPFMKRAAVSDTATRAMAAKITGARLPLEAGRPELVAPMAVYLASSACAVNGEAFSAGGRRFSRVFVGLTDGWLGPPDRDPTAEDVAAHLDEIEDRTSYSLPTSAWDELRGLAEAIAGRG